jgi:hypothetical protein
LGKLFGFLSKIFEIFCDNSCTDLKIFHMTAGILMPYPKAPGGLACHSSSGWSTAALRELNVGGG